ncbi:hypothetical protein ELH70_14450 [Rhizobium ruizarguesonis]|uniref:T3SS effector HopA1 family protein n=1 Tax=Rhizobium ruizarguesonis TaxID=2081791 RepID=UPI00103117B3|nr:T3SS effector HopA1 family protein [Rhizobium ruizarguesonis]TAZ73777.1 hypothetical protein ELH70_14450 [Rhizobium ruizarguesonis]TBA00396.1 hypothetical protein ELH69_13760 [Rhizobium ruizarguesonis]
MTDSDLGYLLGVFSDLRLTSAKAFALGSDLISVGEGQSEFRNQLCRHLYVRIYTTRFRTTQYHKTSSDTGHDITATLSAANSSRTIRQDGWIVRSINPDGSLTCDRGTSGTGIFFADHVYSRNSRFPASIGDQVIVEFPRELRQGQESFYFALGEERLDGNDLRNLVRLYWNVGLSGAPRLTNVLTRNLNKFKIPFQFKAGSSAPFYQRCDSAVLYIARRHFNITAAIVAELLPQLRPLLSSDVPLFTKLLEPGLSAAEDPGTGESYGESRCAILADGILTSWQRGDETAHSMLREVERQFELRGLSINQPYLRPGSNDVYYLPR